MTFPEIYARGISSQRSNTTCGIGYWPNNSSAIGPYGPCLSRYKETSASLMDSGPLTCHILGRVLDDTSRIMMRHRKWISKEFARKPDVVFRITVCIFVRERSRTLF